MRFQGDLMAPVRKLSCEIGPRGSTTPEERAASEYVAETLSSLGLTTVIEPFAAQSSFSYAHGLLYLCFVALVFFYPVSPALVFALALLTCYLYYREASTLPSLGTLIPARPTQNVVARLPKAETEKDRPEVVVVAHVDSSKSALSFHPKLVGGFRRSFLLMVGSMVAETAALGLGVLAQAVAIAGLDYRPFWYASWLPAAYLLFAAGLLVHRELWGKYTPGANDNASGVAVLLAVAKDLSTAPPCSLDVTFLATGAEESGTYGIQAYLARHKPDRDRTFFINLDNLGAGDIKYITAEGILKAYAAGPALISAAQRACLENPPLPVTGRPYLLLTTDATPALVRGYQAMSIMAMTPEGTLPNWHWPTDTAENVSLDNLSTAAELVVRIIRGLDERPEA